MNINAKEILKENKKELYDTWVREVEKSAKQLKVTFIKENHFQNDLFESIYNSLKSDEEHTNNEFEELYSRIVSNNKSLDYLAEGFQFFRRSALTILLKEDLTKEEVLDIYNEIDRWFDPVFNKMINKCTDTWEKTLNKQKETLVELSAPVIQLFEDISVMPLVGNIDEDRISMIKENLLNGVAENHSSIVFLDITGVPVLDTFAAQGIIESTRAANLLGIECILVGIRPEIAQTLINLGIDLKEIRTFSSLNNGLLFAQNKLNIDHK